MCSWRGRMFVTGALLVLTLAISPARSWSENPDELGRAAIRPSMVRLAPTEACAFRVVLNPGWLQPSRVADEVSWAVNGIEGGNESIGTIDKDGVYHAPGAVPRPSEVHICATAKQASNQRLWATVIVGDGSPVYELVSKWEEPADASSHLKDPSDIAIERDGNLIITDAGRSQVFRFSVTGELLGQIGEGGGNAPGHFDGPRGVAIDSEGNIAVADVRTGPPRIQVFNHDGKLIRAFAQKGVGPGMVMQTRGMAFDASGRLLVADMDNMRVNVYTNDGDFLEAWEKNGVHPGEFNEPYGVVIDQNGDVSIHNYYGPCQKFTRTGNFLFAFAYPDPPTGPVAYTAVAGDQWGDVFLAVRDTAGLVQNSVDPEPKPVRMLKFNSSGELVT
ncbi:MAG: NHL repeat-containing protein, partial [Candidatus Hydrogenedentes bacterium]|nr:NHL repeat-containing protein [Candidatus Hydrogenedentota bacterium]